MVELTLSQATQRLEVWYTRPDLLSALEERIRASARAMYTHYTDEDGGLARLVMALLPRAAV
jgi:hypothetical protein